MYDRYEDFGLFGEDLVHIFLEGGEWVVRVGDTYIASRYTREDATEVAHDFLVRGCFITIE